MRNNLELIEKHRQKMGFLVGFVIFLFIYLCFSIFWITSVIYLQKLEAKSLDVKVDRVQSALKTREAFIESSDEDTRAVIQSIFQDTFIVANNGQIVTNDIDLSIIEEISDEPINTNFEYDGFAYKKFYFEDDGIGFNITARIESHNFPLINIIVFLGLLIFAPILFIAMAFVGCRIMHKVYRPVIKIVENLEDFSLSVNHEFKTSLSEIISTLELAKMTGEYEEPVEQSLNSSKRLNNILDSLGMLIRFVNSEYRRKKSNIIKLLDSGIQDYQKRIHDKNLNIIKKYSPDGNITLFIDEEPLQLCFNNIFKNAIRYSHKGANIEIDIQKKYFSIKDYGIGIEEKNTEKIFERYFRENYNRAGTGIGLSLVKRICDKYGWEISVKSKKDSYTKFTLYFEPDTTKVITQSEIKKSY